MQIIKKMFTAPNTYIYQSTQYTPCSCRNAEIRLRENPGTGTQHNTFKYTLYE